MNIPESVKNLLAETGCKNLRSLDMKYDGYTVFEPLPDSFLESNLPDYILFKDTEARFATGDERVRIYKKFYLD